MTRIRAIVLFSVFALLAVGVSACGGGGGGGSEDPQKVLDQTFTGQHKVDSGKLALEFKADASQGNFDAKLDGPFQSQGSGKVPKFDLTVSVSGSAAGKNLNFDGGLVSTGDAAYVKYQGQTYSVPSTLFDQFKSQLESASKTSSTSGTTTTPSLSKFGISPKDWLTNLKNDGDADVEGTSTIHISGDVDVQKFVADLQTLVSKAGSLGIPSTSSTPSAAQLDQLKSAIKNATFDVYSGKDDHIVRKLDFSLEIAPPQGGGSAKIAFSLTLSDVNKPQTITAPAGAKSLDELLKKLGLPAGALGALSGAGGGGFPIPGGGGGTTPSAPSTGAPSGVPNAQQAQQIQACIAKAKSAADLQACSALVPK